MASIEVAYEFKAVVSVLVASQDLMYSSLTRVNGDPHAYRTSINYIDLLLKLTPNLNPITIGQNSVHGFIDIVSAKDAVYNRATLSALDLGHAGRFRAEDDR